MNRFLLTFMLGCLVVQSCSNDREESGLPRIDLANYYESSHRIVSDDNRYDKWFDDYKAVFLENTSCSDLHDHMCIAGNNGKAIILLNGRIRAFDIDTGKECIYFSSGNDRKYTCFDLDYDNGKLYAIDSSGRIDCILPSGKIADSLQMDSSRKYDMLILLEENILLATVSNYSDKESYLADFGTKKVSAYDIPKKSSLPSEIDIKRMKALRLKLYTVIKTHEGDVLIKYIFDDIVYKYGKEGKTPAYQVIADGDLIYTQKGLTFKGKATDILTGLWPLGDSLNLVRHNLVKKGRLYNIFTICNKDMSIYNTTVYYNSSWMTWKSSIFNIYDIFLYDIIHIQPEENRIYKLMSYGKKTTAPPALRDYPEKNQIILCHYNLKKHHE